MSGKHYFLIHRITEPEHEDDVWRLTGSCPDDYLMTKKEAKSRRDDLLRVPWKRDVRIVDIRTYPQGIE